MAKSGFGSGAGRAAGAVALCLLGALVYQAVGLIGVSVILLACLGGQWAIKAARARGLLLVAGLLLAACAADQPVEFRPILPAGIEAHIIDKAATQGRDGLSEQELAVVDAAGSDGRAPVKACR